MEVRHFVQVVAWVFSGVALLALSNNAHAACNTASITGSCVDIELPSSAGNTSYVIETGADVSASSSSTTAVLIDGTIGSFTNNGSIDGTANNKYSVIMEDASVMNGDFTNNGTMLSDYARTVSLRNSTINGSFINNGSILNETGSGWVALHMDGMTITGSITNSSTGVISSETSGELTVELTGSTIGSFNNAGLIENSSIGWVTLGLFSTSIGDFRNSGTISSESDSSAMIIWADWRDPTVGSHVGTFINTGSIVANGESNSSAALWIKGSRSGVGNESTVGTLTNTGTIFAENDRVGIQNDGGLTTLNNYQGQTGSYGSALTYGGILPTHYNMIAYGDDYGQLDVASHSGTMTFGIFGGDSANGISASQLNFRTYEDVVTGVSQSAFANSFVNGASYGLYNGYVWKLTDATYRSGSNTEWDLTLTSVNFGSQLYEPQRSLLERRQQAMRNGLNYDCPQFDDDGLCVSFKARSSGFDGERQGAGVLTVAKRLDTGLRVGLFADAPLSSSEVDGVQLKSGMPMFGFFAAYSGGKDDTGLQIRVASAVEHSSADISHTNFVGSAEDASASANVDTSGILARIGWGIDLGSRAILTPYVGLRATETKRDAYSEAYIAGEVEDPLRFDAFSSHRKTVLLGTDLEGQLTKDVEYKFGLGIEHDVSNRLSEFNFSSIGFGDQTFTTLSNPRVNRMFGLAGIGYAIEQNRTLTLDGNASQMDYGDSLAYSLLAGYRMAF